MSDDAPEVTSSAKRRGAQTPRRKARETPATNEVTATRRRSKAAKSAPENAIHERLPRNPEQPPTPARGVGRRAEGKGAPARRAPAAPHEPTVIPPEIEKRFVRVGHKFYFPDGARAFTDRGRWLTTPSENTEVIKSLIAIAQARGWRELVVTGTERFRKEAWLVAQAAGLEARGYRPSEFEQAHAVRARARQETRTPRRGRDEAAAPESADRSTSRASSAEHPHKGWIRGRLIDHGAAKYRHDPLQPASYFVKVETERGERTLWGVDLERAVKQALSRPKVGDEIGMRVVGREPVTVKSPAVNGQGQVVGTRDVGKHRNRWVVEQQDLLKQRAAAAHVFADATIEAKEGARRHPELLGSYLQLQSAKALAAERMRDPQDQKQFVQRIRHVLAQSIARGEPLAPVRLREPPSRSTPHLRRAPDQVPQLAQ